MKYSGDTEARLLEAIRQETEAFGQMLEMTKGQAELIAADDIEGFDKSLDRRQKHIEKINGLHQGTGVLMQSYISHMRSAGGKKNIDIEAASAQLRDLIAKCAEINEKNMTAAKEKAEGYTQRIDKLSKDRKTLGSYIQTVENVPEMFDKMT